MRGDFANPRFLCKSVGALLQGESPMPYAEGRTYNDADSHIMETRDWLASYIDPRLRDRLPPPDFSRTGRMADAIGKVRDEQHWKSVNLAANLMNLKGWDAYGAT